MPVREVMLHHVVYKNRSRRDPVCKGTESFYGTERRTRPLDLPPGYGYRVRRRDRWSTGWMLMNHRNRRRVAFIEYSAWIETSQRLRRSSPMWVRATGCEGAQDPIFNVPGLGGPGSLFTRSDVIRRAAQRPHRGRQLAPARRRAGAAAHRAGMR